MCQALVVPRLLLVLLHNTAGRGVQRPGLNYTQGRLEILYSLSPGNNWFNGHVDS